jgi:ATP-dependent DNA helicase RecG
MRPSILDPLFAPITSLPGIGPKSEVLYRRLLGRDTPRVLDLLFHLPTGIIDRRKRTNLGEMISGAVVTAEVVVESRRPPPPHRPQAPYLVHTGNDTGTLTLAYFSSRKDYIEKLFPDGARRWVSGTVTAYDGRLQMVHPDRVVDDPTLMPAVEPVYRLTEGLSANMLRKAIAGALGTLPALPEWCPDGTIRPTFAAAL